MVDCIICLRRLIDCERDVASINNCKCCGAGLSKDRVSYVCNVIEKSGKVSICETCYKAWILTLI